METAFKGEMPNKSVNAYKIYCHRVAIVFLRSNDDVLGTDPD
jgi:hypothetical protein